MSTALGNLTVPQGTNPPMEIPDSSRIQSVVLTYGLLLALSLALYSVARRKIPALLTPRLASRAGGQRERGRWCCWWEVDLSWSWKALAYREADLLRLCGVDGYVMLRVVRFCWAMLTAYSVIALATLVPFYYTAMASPRCKALCDLALEAADVADPWDVEVSCVCNRIDRASMAAVPARSPALWMPVAVMALLTVVTLFACKREYEAMVRIQGECWEKLPQAYSVIVEHVPGKLRDQSGTKLRRYFESIFPGQVVSVEMVDTGSKLYLSLRAVAAQRNYVVRRLERVRALLAPQLPAGTTRTPPSDSDVETPPMGSRFAPPRRADDDHDHDGCCCSCSSEPNLGLLHDLAEELEVLNARFRRRRNRYLDGQRLAAARERFGLEQGEGLARQRSEPRVHFAGPEVSATDEAKDGADWDSAPERRQLLRRRSSGSGNRAESDMLFSAAFVTFKGLMASTVSAQSQIDDNSDMRVVAAPEPLDVSWDNIGMTNRARAIRRALTKSAFYFILLFWGVLTSVVGAATSAQALSRQFPALRSLMVEHPSVAPLLDQFAPLVLVSLVGVVNPLMGLLARSEGRLSESAADKRAMERYFAFLVIQVFLFYSVAGTVFKTFVEILQQPSRIVDKLGATIPRNAAFYIQFVVVKLFWMLCMELMRVANLCFACMRRVVAGPPVTHRERVSILCGCFGSEYPAPIDIPSTLAQVLLVFFIAIVYAVIQPLILPAAFVFFALGNVVYTTVLTSASKFMYDGGGRFWWPSAYRCIVTGLVTAQLTLIGVLFIKQGYPQVLPMWLLAFATMFFGYKIDNRYSSLVSALSVHQASKIDRERADLPVLQVRPSVWQYGAVVPGYPNPRRSDRRVVYSYKHPVLNEPDEAVPDAFNLLAQDSPRPHELAGQSEPATRYGTLTK